MRPKDEWKALGYVENEKCYQPGGAKSREHVRSGRCSWTAKTCAGKVRVCEYCGIPYCEYHFEKHLRTSKVKISDVAKWRTEGV